MQLQIQNQRFHHLLQDLTDDTGPQPVVGSTFKASTASTPRRVVFDDTPSDDLDVPDFLK
jgi:hypothetical protein